MLLTLINTEMMSKNSYFNKGKKDRFRYSGGYKY